MPDQASVKFSAAHRNLCRAADADPEWFDLARDVLKEHDTGDVLLLHAIMIGMKRAYEAGKAGKGLPPLRFVQSIAKEVPSASAAAKRVLRSPTVSAQPQPIKRVVRGAKT